MEKKRRYVAAAAGILVCIAAVSGCSRKMTPEKLIRTVQKNMQEVRSASSSLEIDIELEDILDHMQVSVEMSMEHTLDPAAGHAAGHASADINGNEAASEIEIYQVKEGKNDVMYSSMYGQWTRSEDTGASNTSSGEDFFRHAEDAVEGFWLAKEPVEVKERQCYEIYGDMEGEKLMEFLGKDMIEAYGLAELPQEDALEKLEIPVILDIYQEEKLPARILVDMTEIMDQLYESYGRTMGVNHYKIEVVYDGYNETEKISVPDEVKNAAQADTVS